MSALLYDEAAELAVLGAVVVRNGAMDDISDLLEPEHFGRSQHRTAFAGMRALHRKGQPIDQVTLAAEVQADPELRAFLHSLGHGVPRSLNVSAYAAVVRDKALLRSLRDESRRVLADAEAEILSGAALLEQAEQAIYRLSATAVRTDWVSGEALAAELWPLVEQLTTDHRPVTGLETGFVDLDRMTRGLQKGDLVLIGARPGSGKTAIGLQVAMHVAKTSPVAFFSVEMARQPIGLRSVIAAAQVDGFRMLSGYLGELELMRVGDGLAQLSAASIYFDESPMLSPIHVRSKVRRLIAKTGAVALVVIDYLQLMAALPEDRRETKTNQVAGISRALKLLAREFGVPFLVLAQLNRGLERSADKRPTLSDLRDSGALEQDADVVLLMHRPEMYEHDNPALSGIAELIVAKQRNGPTGTVPMEFHKAQMRFESARNR